MKSLNPIVGPGDKNNQTNEFDVQKSYKLLECLVLLSSAITTAISKNPVESAELENKHEKIEKMMKRMLLSDSMDDEAKLLSALLGMNLCPLIESCEKRDALLRKLRAKVFTDSIIMTYISHRQYESHMYTLIGSWQVKLKKS